MLLVVRQTWGIGMYANRVVLHIGIYANRIVLYILAKKN